MNVRVACLMMQRDEEDLLLPWALYHSALFGMANLYIFDNGSTSLEVKRQLVHLSSLGANIIYGFTGPDDFHRKGDLLGTVIKERAGEYDFFVPLDCDEFFVLKAEGPAICCDPTQIASTLLELKDEPRALKVQRAFYNVLNHESWYWFWPHCKTFFAARSFEYLDKGYHAGRTIEGGEVSTAFAHVHYHHKPYSVMLEHSRNKLRPYVDVNDPVALSTYNGTGFHCVKYITQSRDVYESRFTTGDAIFQPAFSSFLESIGVKTPFSE